MKSVAFWGITIALTATCVAAGSPDAPGANGAFVNFAKEIAQGEDNFDAPNGWGKEVELQSRGGPLGKLGTFMKDDPFGLTSDGKPNPDADSGRGND